VESPNIEDAVRRRMWRQQFANTLAIMVFALAIVALAAFFVQRGRLFHRPAPPVVRHAPKPTAARPRPAAIAPPTSVVMPTSVVTPASVAQAVPPVPKQSAPAPAAQKPRAYQPQASLSRSAEQVRPAPEPAATTPVQQSAPAQSPYEMPGANGATRVLVGIKCVDDFRYEGLAGGRHYFSARCQSGSRRSVSCVGGGCKIEYAPPPSHVP
jgi:hypothetical protein